MKNVKVFITDWCPHCKRAETWIKEIKQENPKYKDIQVEIIDEKNIKRFLSNLITIMYQLTMLKIIKLMRVLPQRIWCVWYLKKQVDNLNLGSLIISNYFAFIAFITFIFTNIKININHSKNPKDYYPWG